MWDRTPGALETVTGTPIPTVASPGRAEVAARVARRVAAAATYLRPRLGVEVDLRLRVLDEPEWEEHATFPVYGMPHFADERTLVVAAGDADFWHAVAPPAHLLAAEERSRLHEVYGTDGGRPRLAGFFDLLAVHELAHIFHLQGRRQFPRLWLQELFANVCLHAYVASEEPMALPQLETFPSIVASAATDRQQHHSLADFERLYVGVGPENYGWYQCRLHLLAGRLWGAAGENVLARYWELLPAVPPGASDRDLAPQLSAVHPKLARAVADWPA